MTKTVTVEGEKFHYEISRDRETEDWIGVCHSLKITGVGKTEDDLQQYMCETIEDLLKYRADEEIT
jgi:hypothetical protein